MPEYPHNRYHIFLNGRAASEVYVGPSAPRKQTIPSRNRQEHAQRLAAELAQALTSARQLASVHVRRAPDATPGYYLDFALSPQSGEFLQSLENRQQGIELLSVRTSDRDGEIFAAVFVPSGAENFFLKR